MFGQNMSGECIDNLLVFADTQNIVDPFADFSSLVAPTTV
jgi:hypothetical protein